MLVYFDDIEHRYGRDHRKYLYAHLYNAETGELTISADMSYCLWAIRDKNWIVVKKPIRKTN